MTREERLLALKQDLIARRDQLRNQLDDRTEYSSSKNQSVGDVGDFALECESTDLFCQLASIRSSELEQIEMALQKFREGMYGVCEISGLPIPIERLEVLPFSRFSVEVQRLQEEARANGFDGEVDWAHACDLESVVADREMSIVDLDYED